MQVLVSIIVPVYGHRDITPSLRSIQLQNYTNFECVVIVDGSTDSSCLKYGYVESLDSRFSLLSYETNKGASYARRLV